jgi:hypothetical protein
VRVGEADGGIVERSGWNRCLSFFRLGYAKEREGRGKREVILDEVQMRKDGVGTDESCDG